MVDEDRVAPDGRRSRGGRRAALSLDMTVEEMLDRWPQLNAVLLRFQMACAGCAMAPFERLSDVARSYGISSTRLLGELRAARRPTGRQEARREHARR